MSEKIPKAIIKWPNGLDSTPIFYPLGETDEQTEKIRQLLERALTGVEHGR